MFFSVVVAYAIGAVWYSPKVFLMPWLEMTGVKEKDMQKNGMKAMLYNLPITIGIAMYISGWYTFVGLDSVWYGLALGLDLGTFVCLFIGMNYLYEWRPFSLFAITAGYTLLTSMLM